MADIIRQDVIEKKIFLIRNLNVMLDRDLAGLYDVETKYLTRQIRQVGLTTEISKGSLKILCFN